MECMSGRQVREGEEMSLREEALMLWEIVSMHVGFWGQGVS